jgi:WD40 repeat protein
MRARGAYRTVALSGDGARVAAGGGRDGELDVWSVDDHALLAVADLGTTWPGTDGPVALSVGGAFAAMSNGSAIVVIDLASGAQRRYADSADSSGLAFVDGDRKLAVAHYGFSLTGGGYGALSLLDLASGAFTELFHDPDYNVVEQMLASADGRTIITSGTRVRVWDAATGAQLADRQSDGNDLLGVTADGGQFVTHVSVGATVHLQYRRTSDGAVTNEVLVAPLTDTRWSWGGDLLLMSQPFPLENVPIVVAVDLSARSVLARACSPVHADISGFSQDGERLVSWPSRSAFVFDARTGAPIFPGVEPTVDVWQVVLSPDGRNLAWTVLSPGRDGTGPLNVVLADVDRRTTATLAGQRSVRLPYGGAVAFSADSSKLAVFDEGEEILDVFDVATKTLLAEQALPFSNGFLLGFTPDGQGLRIYSDRAVQIVSWQDGATRPGWPPNGDFPSSSVDARTLVAGDQDGAALYRDEVLVASLPIPSDRCVGPSWIFRVSPGGGVASVSHDCGRPWMSSVGPYLEIFDAATGAELQTIHQEIVPAFSWDGSQFADGNTLWCR